MKLFHDPKAKLIKFLDERYYTLDNVKFYPGVTTILEVYPKGYGFTEYLKKIGMNADAELKKAGDQGTRIHDSIDRYLKGEELLFQNEEAKEPNYTKEEWVMINKFIEFENKYKPVTLAQEIKLVDEEMGCGGTLDRVCIISNELWLVDYKSSNFLHKNHVLQLAAYRAMWNRKFPKYPIRHMGDLHLKASTRGESKNGIIQGKGWQLKEPERPWVEYFKIFEHSRAIWYEENPDFGPKFEEYPDRLKMKEPLKVDEDFIKGLENDKEKTEEKPKLEVKPEIKKTPATWGATKQKS
jgi:hypothetical protein